VNRSRHPAIDPSASDAEAIGRRARRRRNVTGAAVLVGGLSVIVIAAVIAWTWRSRLPDPVASHWGISGTPDGFSSFGSALGLLLGLGGGLVLVFGVATWGLGRTSVTRRIAAAATAWVAVFLSIVVLGTLYIQLDLPDARDVGNVDGVMLVALIGSILPAVVVAAVVPGDERLPTAAPVAADAPRVRLVDGERATWIGRVSSPVAFIIAVPVVVLSVIMVVIAQAWVMLAIAIAVMLAVVTLSSFVVRVDRAGLTIRSALGWPRYRVPLDEVVRADVTQVSPLKDFGGWGWRVGRDGRVGVVLRKGESLLVERTGGRSIVVTVDGAATAAGLVNALADRGRRPS
jgi:hypothetical protein